MQVRHIKIVSILYTYIYIYTYIIYNYNYPSRIVSIIDSIIDVYYCVHYIMCVYIYISIAFFLIADSMTGIVSRNMLLIY